MNWEKIARAVYEVVGGDTTWPKLEVEERREWENAVASALIDHRQYASSLERRIDDLERKLGTAFDVIANLSEALNK